jgi:hypothetical protein
VGFSPKTHKGGFIVKRKALVLILSGILFLAALPAGLAGAAQGTMDYVSPASTFTKSTGYANVSQTGTNVIKFRVTDTDLNTNKALAGNLSTLAGKTAMSGKGMIIGAGDGATNAFSIATTVRPVVQGTVQSVQDLQSGIGYLAAIGASGASLTLQPTPGAIPTGDTGIGAITAAEWERIDIVSIITTATANAIATQSAFSGAARLKATILNTNAGKIATASTTAAVLVFHGTTVDPVTLAQTTGQSETLTFATMATGITTVLSTTKIFLNTGLTYDIKAIVTSANAGFRLRIQEKRTLVASFKYGVFNDTDTGAGTTASPYTQSVKVTSTSNSTGIGVTLYETDTSNENLSKISGKNQRVVANYANWVKADDPDSGSDVTTVRKDTNLILSKGIALIDGAVLTAINTRRVATGAAAHQFTNASSLTQVISALNTSDPAITDNTATTAVDESKQIEGKDWVTNTAVPLGFAGLNTAGVQGVAANANVRWEHLAAVTLGVSDTDVVTLVYTDANGTAVSKTITVDLSKPAISGASPAKSSSTNSTTPQLKATVSDTGVGFDTTTLTNSIVVSLTPSGGSAATQTFSAVINAAGGYEIVAVPSALAVTTGHVWSLTATDKVGNKSTTGDFTFAVDNVKPTVVSAVSGLGLKLTTGKTDEYEETISKLWIKVVMSEDMDTTSLQAADFTVPGYTVTSVLSAKKTKQYSGASLGSLGSADRENVYLKLTGNLAADAKPKVSVAAAITDVAGNASKTGATTTGAYATATDAVKPTLTLTVTDAAGVAAGTNQKSTAKGKLKQKITIIVTSDEALLGDVPTIKVDTTGIATTKTGTNAWTATYVVASSSRLATVTASGSDVSSNAATNAVKKFHVDANAPTITFANAAGTNTFAANGTRDVSAATAGLQVEEADVIFVPILVNDVAPDNYGTVANDTLKTGTFTSGTLKTMTKFGATLAADITNTATLTATDVSSSDSISHVYAGTALPLGYYKLAMKFTDASGNAMAADTAIEFQVTAQAKTSIAANPGWTLISTPGKAQDTSIATVFAGTEVTSVWSYNAKTSTWEYGNNTAGTWSGTLTDVVDGRSYFVRSTSFNPIKVLLQKFDPQRSQPQYGIYKGWNSVGYTPGGAETQVRAVTYLSSLGTGGWSVIRTWNASLSQYESAWADGSHTTGFVNATSTAWTGTAAMLQKGVGYLLYAPKNGVLAP